MNGEVILEVIPELPVKGIQLLLGNDLAGGQVFPQLIMQPSLISTDAQEDKSELYPACVITRSMTKHQSSKVSKPIDASSNSSLLTNLPLPTYITHAYFVTAQQLDEEIKNIKDRLI